MLLKTHLKLAFFLQNSIRHTLSVRQRFVRLPRLTNGSVSHKSWWTLSDDFLRKRPALGASPKKPSMPAVTNEKYTSKETQTVEFVCGRCSCAVFRKKTEREAPQISLIKQFGPN